MERPKTIDEVWLEIDWQAENISEKLLHTARLFPDPGFRTSKPPGPMLLLLDFLSLEALEDETSMVAFSLSMAFRVGDSPPTDLLLRRVAGSVLSMFVSCCRSSRLLFRFNVRV